MEMRARDPFERRRVHRAQLEIRHALLASPLSGDGEHALRDVDPQDGAARPHAVRRWNRRLTASGGQIEDAHSRTEAGKIEHPLAQRRGQPRLHAVVGPPDFLGARDRAPDRHTPMLSREEPADDGGRNREAG
jgi:hypothetical protein